MEYNNTLINLQRGASFLRTDLRWGIRLVGFEFIGWAAVMETPVGCGQYEGGDGEGKDTHLN